MSSTLPGMDGEGRLRIMCWCERDMGQVPARMVRSGETFTCGHPDCHPPKKSYKPRDV